jgi:hypothetical protein
MGLDNAETIAMDYLIKGRYYATTGRQFGYHNKISTYSSTIIIHLIIFKHLIKVRPALCK